METPAHIDETVAVTGDQWPVKNDGNIEGSVRRVRQECRTCLLASSGRHLTVLRVEVINTSVLFLQRSE